MKPVVNVFSLDAPQFDPFVNREGFHCWLERALPPLQAESFTSPKIRYSFASCLPPAHPGPERNRFCMAAYLSELGAFPREADQVDFPRLYRLIDTFPQGFRLWSCELPGGKRVPVGYTGWYPITKDVFEVMESDPARIPDRAFMMPQTKVNRDGTYLYLQNAGIIPQLRHTLQSREMMRTRAEDIAKVPVLGMSAVACSADGERVISRFGLKKTGEMVYMDEVEHVMTRRFDAATLGVKVHPRKMTEQAVA